MKKLRKANLDELAEKLPVASKEENLECVGGNYYFDSGGNFLGEVGSSDYFRLISYSDYVNNIDKPWALEGLSTKPSESIISQPAMANMASHFTRPWLGIDQQDIIIYSGYFCQNQWHFDQPGAYNGFQLFLNDDWRNIKTFDSYFNFRNTMNYATSSGLITGYMSKEEW